MIFCQSKGTVAKTLRKLEDKGYIERIDIIDNDKKGNKDKTEYKGKDNNN